MTDSEQKGNMREEYLKSVEEGQQYVWKLSPMIMHNLPDEISDEDLPTSMGEAVQWLRTNLGSASLEALKGLDKSQLHWIEGSLGTYLAKVFKLKEPNNPIRLDFEKVKPDFYMLMRADTERITRKIIRRVWSE